MSFDPDLMKRTDAFVRAANERKAATQKAMAELMPAAIPDPEKIAAETYEAFRRGLNLSHCTTGRKVEVEAIMRDFGIVADALRQYRTALSGLSQLGIYYIEEAASERGIDVGALHDQLSTLAEICEVPKIERARGKVKDHNTVAALKAAQCLMDHGIKRQRAAKIVAVMTRHYPGVEEKEWPTIQAAMVDAGMTAKPKKLVKGTRRAFISLTPG